MEPSGNALDNPAGPPTGQPSALSESDRKHLQRRTLGVLGASTVAVRGGFTVLFTVAALSLKDLLGSGTWAGLATVATTLGATFSAAALASYMARKGRNLGLTLGYGAAAIGGVVGIIGFEQRSIPIFLLGLMLVGIGQGATRVGRYAAADLSTDENRSRDISLIIFAGTLGAVGGPLLVGVAGRAGEDLGLEKNSGVIGLSLLMFAVGTAIVFALLRPDPLIVAGHATESGAAEKGSLREAFRLILERPLARLALVSLVISQTVMVMVMTMTPLHMDAHDHSGDTVGQVIASHTLGMFAFAPIAGIIADRIGRVRSVAIGGGILAAATTMTALAGEAPRLLMFPGLYLLGLGWSFGIVAGSALLTESVEPKDRVSVQGAADMASNFASGCGALISGVVFEMQGFHVLSMIGIVAAGALLLHSFWEFRVTDLRAAGRI